MPLRHSKFSALRATLLIVLSVILTSCTVNLPGSNTSRPDLAGSDAQTSDNAALRTILAEAANLPTPQAEARYADAAQLMLSLGMQEEALALIDSISPEGLPAEQRTALMMLRADALIANNRATEALPLLNSEELSALQSFSPETRIQLRDLRARSFFATEQYLLSAQERIYLDGELSPLDQLDNHELIWQALMQLEADQLESLAGTSIAFDFQGWYELGVIGKSMQFDLDSQQAALSQWLEDWQRHPAADSLPTRLQVIANISQSRPSRVALMLPLQSTAGKAVRDGFMSAWYAARDAGIKVPELRLYDTTGAEDIASIHARARSEGAELVIGPLLKSQATQLASTGYLGVPTLALNTIDEPGRLPQGFYQFSLAPENEIAQIADYAIEKGYTNAAILSHYESGDTYYGRKRDTFRQLWSEAEGKVVSEDLFTNDITPTIERLLAITESEERMGELSNLLNTRLYFTPRRRQDIDFILLMADPADARQINPSLAYLFAGDIPVIATKDVYGGKKQPQLDTDLNGIIFSDSPWLLNDLGNSQEETLQLFPQSNATLARIQAFGVDAFRLHSRLQQLEIAPGTIMTGATGQLTMNENRVISQTLNWAQFENGIAVPE